MMKFLLASLVLLISFKAAADDFYCTLEIGNFSSVSAIAEYRGRVVSLETELYDCKGEIDSNIDVKTTITSRSGSEVEVKSNISRATSEVKMSTLDQFGDGVINLKCTCGLM